MVLKIPARETVARHIDRRTLIMGDLNCGKTRLTRAVIEAFCECGHGGRTAVLDLAPDEIDGIGGKLVLPQEDALLSLTCPIVPPRLTGDNETRILDLARQNAACIEPLMDQILAAGRPILFINDASLYLQAGSIARFLAVVGAHSTVVINAYYGDSFDPTPFSAAERKQVEMLADHCDTVLHMDPPPA